MQNRRGSPARRWVVAILMIAAIAVGVVVTGRGMDAARLRGTTINDVVDDLRNVEVPRRGRVEIRLDGD